MNDLLILRKAAELCLFLMGRRTEVEVKIRETRETVKTWFSSDKLIVSLIWVLFDVRLFV